MTLTETVVAAKSADHQFGLAILAAGYKSRWDWDRAKDQRPLAAYHAKLAADEAMHNALEAVREAQRESLRLAKAARAGS